MRAGHVAKFACERTAREKKKKQELAIAVRRCMHIENQANIAADSIPDL